jgi:hypothetical protein
MGWERGERHITNEAGLTPKWCTPPIQFPFASSHELDVSTSHREVWTGDLGLAYSVLQTESDQAEKKGKNKAK